MTKKDILAVANKILGIYLVIRAIESLETIALAVKSVKRLLPSEWTRAIWVLSASIVPFLLYIGLSFCLIKWANPIAAKLCARDLTNGEISGIGKDALQEIAFSTVGVFIIANALPLLTQIITQLSYQGEWKQRIAPGMWVIIAGVAIQLAIGIYLFFGSRRLVGLLKKSTG
ncbi:MAG: hypothetical protein PF574_09425 [Candidatus Delongbacteria bacterium]|jgi:VIT1/CCC1 family predicted Fe2+/Mn2+ transporter|nr:hypothetical protein [Candidatus Delongbacteria bacterium]